MSRKRKQVDSGDSLSIWTAFTDLMSNAFMVITLLLLLVVVKTTPLLSNSVSKSVSKSVSSSTLTKNEDPPIIILPSEKYQFDSGSAVLPQNLKNNISFQGKEGIIVKDIELALKKYPNIDVVEVIGHTDGQPIGKIQSNLDKNLEKVAHNQFDIKELQAGSNADLGLIRALAVAKELQKVQARKTSGKFKNLKFRPYSAAQLLLPDNQGFAKETDKKDNKERRRIEIRFTQLGREIKR